MARGSLGPPTQLTVQRSSLTNPRSLLTWGRRYHLSQVRQNRDTPRGHCVVALATMTLLARVRSPLGAICVSGRSVGTIDAGSKWLLAHFPGVYLDAPLDLC